MPVLICMLRGVNIGGHHIIKMDHLRALCSGLKLTGIQTHLQSGNVIFHTEERDLNALAGKIQAAIDRKCGFRPEILLRTIPEMRRAISCNPFAQRKGMEPSKLAVVFLDEQPSTAARQALSQMDIAPEELHVIGRQLYIYFPNGQARPKISWSRVEKIVGPRFTGRNWNTVTKLLKLSLTLRSAE
jgi:uncharacterized protein (DUF1697 family)